MVPSVEASCELLKQFADSFRSGAQGSTMDCDTAKAMAEAVDRILLFMEPSEERITVQGGDYTYQGYLVSSFFKRRGGARHVVEDDNGRLFIHNDKQMGWEE